MKETVCPMIGQVCRFASEIKIPVVNRTVDLKKKVIRKETTYDNKGVFCNNDGRHYVKIICAWIAGWTMGAVVTMAVIVVVVLIVAGM